MEAREVIIAVKNDSVFHNRSGGGLTVTGGEPLSQPDFLLTLLSLAKGQRLNTAMETSGQAPFEILSQAATKLDSLFYDLKIIDRRKHLEFTGVESTLILDNLLKIYSKFPDLPITVRTPVVPGFNNDRFSAQEIGLFLRKLPNVSFEALPYHSFGSQKYGYLGRPYGLPESGLAESDLSEFNQTVLEYRHGDQSIRTALP
jgi:pyruvate formate lyase activating enzyme